MIIYIGIVLTCHDISYIMYEFYDNSWKLILLYIFDM